MQGTWEIELQYDVMFLFNRSVEEVKLALSNDCEQEVWIHKCGNFTAQVVTVMEVQEERNK